MPASSGRARHLPHYGRRHGPRREHEKESLRNQIFRVQYKGGLYIYIPAEEM
jgi:hypothetical protein